MDRACRSGRFFTGVYGPGARLLLARGKKRAQSEQMIGRSNECVHTAILDTETAQIFQCLLLTEIDKFALDLRANHDGFGREMMACVILNCLDPVGGIVAGVDDSGLR